MVIHINVGVIKTVIITIVVNNVISVAATDVLADDGNLFRKDNKSQDDHKEYNNQQPKFRVQEAVIRQRDDFDNDEDIKALLEEKYKFKNDETSTRFKVTKEERGEFPVFPENHDERQIAWAFRSYAVRRIVGGMESSISMYPYNVAISRNAKHCADYDYALLRLDRPMPIGRNIAVLNLPSKDYLMKESDILIHDSGGPAVRDGVLLGIVSFGGKQCGDPRSPGVYSRVSEITEWVEDTITSNEANTVPELLPKIQKARQREKELQKFKARVEDKKNKIKTWLRETLKSPTFIELAKKKLKEAGFHTRRTNDYETLNVSSLDDKMIDEINLTNMINDRIIDDGDGSESDKLLITLALHEVMLNDKSTEIFAPRTLPEVDSESAESFIAYISGRG
ncbi:hypothetical protein HF086_018400 [Spodoptera exigua]|uniref:Peptidase S1 domain-containing protein n=1 Tax=Spodoptera exigua TaxID=7107 RepID=A0A922SK81_SPOEX|nr:hypothetical protein HF086_018400 [Spodoptera exigua]